MCNHSLEKMRMRLWKMFQKSRKSCTEMPRWSAIPSSYDLIATCVSQAMRAVKRPTAKYASTRMIIIEKGFGPMTIVASSPPSCRAIRPIKLPIKGRLQVSILSLGILQAAREAPPNKAIDIPKAIGMAVGLTAAAMAINEAELAPSPKTPSPNKALRIGELRVALISTRLPSMSTQSLQYSGFMKLEPMSPPMPHTNPPMVITPIVAGVAIASATCEERSAPPTANPVQLYTFDRNLLKPTFLETAQPAEESSVGSLIGFESKGLFEKLAFSVFPLHWQLLFPISIIVRIFIKNILSFFLFTHLNIIIYSFTFLEYYSFIYKQYIILFNTELKLTKISTYTPIHYICDFIQN